MKRFCQSPVVLLQRSDKMLFSSLAMKNKNDTTLLHSLNNPICLHRMSKNISSFFCIRKLNIWFRTSHILWTCALKNSKPSQSVSYHKLSTGKSASLCLRKVLNVRLIYSNKITSILLEVPESVLRVIGSRATLKYYGSPPPPKKKKERGKYSNVFWLQSVNKKKLRHLQPIGDRHINNDFNWVFFQCFDVIRPICQLLNPEYESLENFEALMALGNLVRSSSNLLPNSLATQS